MTMLKVLEGLRLLALARRLRPRFDDWLRSRLDSDEDGDRLAGVRQPVRPAPPAPRSMAIALEEPHELPRVSAIARRQP